MDKITYKILKDEFIDIFYDNLDLNLTRTNNTFFVNCTEFCDKFNKNLSDFLYLKKTQKYLKGVSDTFIVGINIRD